MQGLRARSRIASTNVAIGPSRSETRNHARPLRFLDWASTELISARVPQPTK